MGVILMTEDPKYISVPQAVQETDYSSGYIRRLAIQGRIDAKKFGRDWMIKLEDLLDFKQRMQALGPAKFGIRYDDGDDEHANETG
jgi:excisionase family DNA binding protein